MGVLGFLRRLGRPVTAPADAEKSLSDLLLREAAYDTPKDFFRAILEVVPADQPLSEGAARLLVTRLRGFCDGYGEKNSDALKEVEGLWGDLAERTGDPFVRACRAEALLQRGKKQRALQLFFEVFEERPELLFEFGSELGSVAAAQGDGTLFEYRVLHLRALLDSEADDVRELYSELLDEYAEQPLALLRLQKIGTAIEAAVQAGKLPRALVRRGASRRDGSPERPL